MKKTLLLLIFNLLTIICFSQRISNKSYDTSSDTYWFEKSMDDIPDNYHFYLEYVNFYDYFFDSNTYNSGNSWRGRGYDSYSEFKSKFSSKSGIYKYIDWKVFKAVDFMIYYTDSVVASYSDSMYQLAIDTATVLSANAFQSSVDSATVLSQNAFVSAVDSASVMSDLAQQTAIDSATVISNLAFEYAVDSASILSMIAQQTTIDSAIVLSNNAFISAVDSATILSTIAQKVAIDSASVMYTTLETKLTAVVNDSLSSIQEQMQAYTDSIVTEVQIEGITVSESNNYIGIGTTTPEYMLDVKGTARAEKIIVEANGNTADFVFADDYQLKDLKEVDKYVKKNKHLEGIPSAEEMEKEGVNLAEMNKLLLQKVEELTLYSIELKKELDEKEHIIDDMKCLEDKVAKIEELLLNNNKK